MKYPSAYYLLLLYLTVIFKPLLPVISDAWSHTFNEVEHVATVHAKYGSHHLQNEVAGSASDANSKSQSTLKTEDQVPFHVLTSVSTLNAAVKKDTLQYTFSKPHNLPFVFIFQQTPPPKFS